MYPLIDLEKDKKDKKSYSIIIFKNDFPITKDSESDESDYEYMYNDELQILSETNKIFFS
jgi:hypothetical protein